MYLLILGLPIHPQFDIFEDEHNILESPFQQKQIMKELVCVVPFSDVTKYVDAKMPQLSTASTCLYMFLCSPLPAFKSFHPYAMTLQYTDESIMLHTT